MTYFGFLYFQYPFATKVGKRNNFMFIKHRLMECKQYAQLRLYLNKKQDYCQDFIDNMTKIFCLVATLY